MKKRVFILPLLAAFFLTACSVPGMPSGSLPASPTDVRTSTSSADLDLEASATPENKATVSPDRDIAANLFTVDGLTSAATAVRAADLTAILQGSGPFTVFIPNNEAFNKLPAGTLDTLLKPENKIQLQKTLKYHIVSGRYTTADFEDGMTLKTVEGDTLTLKQNGDKWMVNDANILTVDSANSNGTSFVIDSVLIPSK